MHFSAKRGIKIARRLSRRLSVCDVGGSGPHRLEILETNCTKTKNVTKTPLSLTLVRLCEET